jgi:hypothetical protein
MTGTGYALAAYVASAAWFAGYLVLLRRRERELERRRRRG